MEISAQHRKAEIGYVLSRAYWNRGVMSEALARVLVLAFDQLGLNRIEGFCQVDNHSSRRVLEKAGMKEEGVLRDYIYQKGAFRDLFQYSILKREWDEIMVT